jgi:hypothetical protein
MNIPDPDLDFFPIPDPWVKKAPDPGSGSAHWVKEYNVTCLRSSLSSASQPEIVEMGLWLLSTGSNHRNNNQR